MLSSVREFIQEHPIIAIIGMIVIIAVLSYLFGEVVYNMEEVIAG